MASTAPVVQPLSHPTSFSTPKSVANNSAIDIALAIMAAVLALGENATSWIRHLWRLWLLNWASPILSSEQFATLLTLINLQHQSELSWFLPDIEYDECCTLSPAESEALRVCAAIRVPFEIIDRLAPKYSHTSVYPRPVA